MNENNIPENNSSEEKNDAPEKENITPEADTTAPENETATTEADTTAPENETATTEADTTAPESETATTEAEVTAPENEDTTPKSETTAPNESNISQEPTAHKEEGSRKKARRASKNAALIASSVLSACSLMLLVALALALMLGIIPTGSNTIYQPSVNNTPTQPDTDASPELIEDFLNSVVVVKGNSITSTSTGTGVIISTDGYIVTNYHVIEGCSTVNVSLFGEKTAEKATVVGFHKGDDVAVLKIKRTDLRAAAFVDSNAVRYGEKVYAIGTPEGSDFGWSVTQGIVSSPRRQLMIYDDEGILEKKMNVVQTDASVNHGNSGGPIINVRGEVVGIVTLKRTDSAGMGFALPANGVLKIAQAIIETGSADNVDAGISMPRPLLGVTGVGVQEKTYYKNYTTAEGSGVEIVEEAYAKMHPSTTFYAPISGVYVSATSAGANAASKLQQGDIITEINGNTVTTIYHVMSIINEYNGGDAVTVKYYRDGKYNTVDITLGSAQ